MHLSSGDSDGLGWAVVFTGSTSYALFSIHSRNSGRIPVFRVLVCHSYGPGRAVSGTVAAGGLFPVGHAKSVINHGIAYAYGRFFLPCHRQDCSRRADIRASRTFRAAIASGKLHFRLHQCSHVPGWFQHIVRTSSHAELAGNAMVGKMFQAL